MQRHQVIHRIGPGNIISRRYLRERVNQVNLPQFVLLVRIGATIHTINRLAEICNVPLQLDAPRASAREAKTACA
jgi:hypothetical protein